MKLLYLDEHFSCRNYEKGPRPIIQLKELKCDSPFESRSICGKIVFLLKGRMRFSYGAFYNYPIEEKQMLFLPANHDFILCTDDQAEILIMRLSQKVIFCECYLLESLANQTFKFQELIMQDEDEKPFLLYINKSLEHYLNGLLIYINAGLRCRYYFETRIKELFYLLRAFYRKEDLARFFKDILSSDTCFSQFVMNNYHKYRTLSDMARDMGMSLSNIEKLFSRVFKMSGYKWMNQQKANKVYHALCTENTPFKELAVRFGFSSASSLNDFCKNMLGETPGVIRRKTLVEQNDE